MVLSHSIWNQLEDQIKTKSHCKAQIEMKCFEVILGLKMTIKVLFMFFFSCSYPFRLYFLWNMTFSPESNIISTCIDQRKNSLNKLGKKWIGTEILNYKIQIRGEFVTPGPNHWLMFYYLLFCIKRWHFPIYEHFPRYHKLPEKIDFI